MKSTTAQEPNMTYKLSNQIFRSFMDNARQGLTSDQAKAATIAEFEIDEQSFQTAFKKALR